MLCPKVTVYIHNIEDTYYYTSGMKERIQQAYSFTNTCNTYTQTYMYPTINISFVKSTTMFKVIARHIVKAIW
jgi:hypothetical protein